MGSRFLSVISGLALLGAGCAAEEDVGALGAPLAGKDGALNVTSPEAVINRYAQLAQDAATGDRRLALRGASSLLPLDKGDLLLVIQMQGATIDTSDSARFGEVSALGGAGAYELVTVDHVEGDTVFLEGACRLRRSYSAAGAAQVIRVPQLTTLRVGAAGSVTAPAWNGAVGGVVAVHVQESAQVDGRIDVTGRGFRGGQVENFSVVNDGTNVIWRSTDPARGGEKGEGVAGGVDAYGQLGGRYGRGAPANGGGGGDGHNAGGGGGANGLGTTPWTGQGVMDGGVTGAAAWALDPGYKANGNRLTSSSGGGRGGYTFSQSMTLNVPDPAVLGPGYAEWGGDWRREVGGLGGRPLRGEVGARLFLGGGGGAGDGNDMAAGPGGNGGGLVLVLGGAVSGSGQIVADGQAGGDTRALGNDGAGGGGGGGTIVLATSSAAGVRLSASGGKGGDQPNTAKLTNNREAEGPGGGGGGGFIAFPQGNVTSSAAGGKGGLSTSPFVARFPANGATGGAAGQAQEVASAAVVSICDPGPGGGSDLWIKITASPSPVAPGGTITYTIAVGNKGPDAASDVTVTYTVPEGGTIEKIDPGPGWTCTQKDRVVTCTRQSVPPGQAPDIQIVVRIPDGTTPVTGEGTVGAATPDPMPEDNRATVTTDRARLSLAGGGVTCSLGGRAAGGGSGAMGLLLAIGLCLGLRRRRR